MQCRSKGVAGELGAAWNTHHCFSRREVVNLHAQEFIEGDPLLHEELEGVIGLHGHMSNGPCQARLGLEVAQYAYRWR